MRLRQRPRLSAFDRAAEEPYRRRASDWLRAVLGLALFVPLAQRADHVSPFDQGVFEAFNSLPDTIEPLFRVFWSLGALWAIGMVVAAAIVARRLRLARDLFIAGLLSWGTARLLGQTTVFHTGLRAGLRTLTRLGTTPSFPSVRLAVVVAVVATAGPYVGRPMRRAGQALVAGVALSAMYLGTAYPRDVLGALLLGWTVAAVIHLAFCSPGGRPTGQQLGAILGELGIVATNIHLSASQPTDGTVFHARDAAGSLVVKVIGRDDVEAQLLAKLWRFAAYKDTASTLLVTRLSQVEHEACMILLAQAAGVSVAPVLFVGRAGPDAAVLAEREAGGTVLIDVPPEAVTDDLLHAIWSQVAALHAARITHGALHGDSVMVADGKPTIIDFATATTARFDERRVADVAELLAATAAMTGNARAIAACRAVMGDGLTTAALPLLQTAALSRTTRAAAGASRKAAQARLESLRTDAAAALGTPVPSLEQLHRVNVSSLLLAVGALVAVGGLLGQVGHPAVVWSTIEHAQWRWLAVALTLSMLTNLTYAVALMGCVPRRLPFWPTTELQLAMSYSNLAVPAVGGLTLQVRFLQRRGVELAAAVAAGGFVSLVGNLVAQIGLFAGAIWLAPDSFHLSDLPVTGIAKSALLLAVVAGAAVGIALGIPRLRRAVLLPVRHAASAVWATVRSGRHIALLLGGNLLTNLVYTACLLACLRAFGGTLSFWTALGVNTGVSTLASLIPIPGGGTAVGALGVSGALTAFGVPAEVAVSAVLANNLVVSYLPAIPGWFATRHLFQAGEL